MLHLLFVSQSQQSLADDILKIGLPHIDYVVDGLAMTKGRMNRFTRSRGGHPDIVPVIQMPVVKVLVQQAQLPELVGNILSHIGHSPVGSNDDLVVVISLGIDPHYPAAFVLALILKEDRSP